ncbi:MAG: hypothetical protein SNH13_01995 [Rikenellaceae bacterium]
MIYCNKWSSEERVATTKVGSQSGEYVGESGLREVDIIEGLEYWEPINSLVLLE